MKSITRRNIKKLDVQSEKVLHEWLNKPVRFFGKSPVDNQQRIKGVKQCQFMADGQSRNET